MLTNKATPDRVTIPHEPDEWIEFIPLSWRQLETASKARTLAAIKVAGEIPPGVFEKMGNIQERPEVVEPDPTEQYDIATVLGSSIVAWSYDDECTSENIDALDEATSKWAHKMALERSVRSKSEGEVLAPNSNGITSEMGAGLPS